MSSDDDDRKKRRIQRACDVCRRKKIRCDGAQMADNRCSNCITYKFECTYDQSARKRGPPKGYVESLENRLEKMEALLQKLCPDGDFSQEIGGHFDRESWVRDGGAPMSSSSPASARSPASAGPSSATALRARVALPARAASASEEDAEAEFVSSDEDNNFAGRGLEARLHKLNLNPAQARYIGKSSGATLVRSALALKSGLARGPSSQDALERTVEAAQARRPEYWQLYAWEAPHGSATVPMPFLPPGTGLRALAGASAPPPFTFPPDDLLHTLVDAYFTRVNASAPLLHRPSFARALADGAHRADGGFGALVLVVCAIASRFVDDARVMLDGAPSHSAGWKWFNQVQMVRRSLLAAPCLHDLQLYCLSAMFLQGSSAPQACWSIVGIGIRLAQDVGAHRKKVYSTTPSIHDELWKRAFWVLVTFDRAISAALGRPCAIQDEDFDVDLPTDCDDEYWENEDPALAFKQPPGKPSKVTFFIRLIKLQQVLAFALRTIYSINKSKVLLGFVGQEWEQRIVSELNSALNQWVDSVPDHLRWDPAREDLTFFDQSALLWAAYYQLQIMIHRPFIRTGPDPSGAPGGFPALAICTNAARACARVVDTHKARMDQIVPSQIPAAFVSGIVLLLSIWGGRRMGMVTDPAREMADVHKCMDVMKACEARWHIAGRMWDLLAELASASEVPLPEPMQGPMRKRDRESEQQAQSPTDTSASSEPAEPLPRAPRTLAGSRRVYTSQYQAAPSAAGAPGSSSGFGAPAPAPALSGFSPGSTPQGGAGWPSAHALAAPFGAGPIAGAPADPLAGWWALGDPAAFPGAGAGLAPAHGADVFGAAMDSLLAQGAPPGQGADPLAMWTQAPLGFESEDWSQYLLGMAGGVPSPNQPHH